MGTPDFAAALAAGHNEDDGDGLEDAHREARAVEAKLAGLAEAWAADDLSDAEWKAARSKLQARLDAAVERIARAAPKPSPVDLSGLAGSSAAFRRKWKTLSGDARRALLAQLISEITIAPGVKGRAKFDPEGVDVVWRV